MTFVEAIKTCYAKYATFSGRAMRAEFWYFALFNTVASLIYQAISFSFLPGNQIATIVGGVVMIFLFYVPSLAVSVRRLHDIGRSGWWLLILLVPLVGWVLVIYWHCIKSAGDNAYGPGPEGASVSG